MNKYRTLLIAVGVLVVILMGVVLFFGIKKSDPRFEGSLTIWGIEHSNSWKELVRAFEAEYPKLKVQYEQKNERTYETDLINALAAGRGPDIFEIHHTWLYKHGNKMAGAPAELINDVQFKATFVDAAVDDLIAQGGIVAGVPLYMDTLALYYNKDIFNVHGVTAPPKTWEEFNEVVRRTTVLGTEGAILQAGAALGTQNNIEHADDLLEMFLLQNGSRIANLPNKRATFAADRAASGNPASVGENALSYYTNFADPSRGVFTWSRRMGDAKTSFKDGTVAMYVGYASELSDIRASGVTFDVAPLPQIRNRQLEPSYISSSLARYWAGVVSSASQKKDASWTFLLFATSRNGHFNFLSKTGLPTARRDLIDLQAGQDPQLGVFAQQSLIAKTWPQPDYIAVKDIFKNMIESVTLGRASVEEAVREGEGQVTNLFR